MVKQLEQNLLNNNKIKSMSVLEKKLIIAEIKRLQELIDECYDPNNPDLERWKQSIKNLRASLATYDE